MRLGVGVHESEWNLLLTAQLPAFPNDRPHEQRQTLTNSHKIISWPGLGCSLAFSSISASGVTNLMKNSVHKHAVRCDPKTLKQGAYPVWC